MKILKKEVLVDMSPDEMIDVTGGKTIVEWLYYGIGSIIGAVAQSFENGNAIAYAADRNTIFGHYGGARP